MKVVIPECAVLFCACSFFQRSFTSDLSISCAVQSNISIRKKMNLENEIIAAVVVLYLFLSTVIVLVHYLQPEGQKLRPPLRSYGGAGIRN